MFFKITTLNFLSVFFILALLSSSCKVATPPQLPATVEMPESYSFESNSESIGTIKWREFFKDPYLIALIDTALHNNFDLLSAIQRIEVARSNYMVRKGALLPSLNGIASANLGNVNQNMVGNADQAARMNNIREDYFFGFQSSWEADLWGRLKNQKKAAYAKFLSSEKGKHLLTTTLIAEIARLYYDLLALDNELKVVRRNIDYQKIALEIIKIQKMGGRATELAVQQFTAQLLSTQALEREKLQRIIRVENQINTMLGRFPEAIRRESDISEQNLPEKITSGIPSTLLINRPDIQQAELELEAAKADLEAARAAFLPSLSISPYIGFNALKTSALFQTPESLAIGALGGITAPIFNRKRIRAEFDRSVAERAEAFYNYQQAIISGFGEVATNLSDIQNQQKIYELKEQEVEALQNAVSTSNDLFTSGYASYLEVITAQKGVLEAELELANIKKGIFHSVIDLYRSLGGGWNWNQ